MLEIRMSSRFKRDYDRCRKGGYDMPLLWSVVDVLRIPAQLEPKHRDHSLNGQYAGYRECHVLPDWLLVYRSDARELYLYRLGTHSELFK